MTAIPKSAIDYILYWIFVYSLIQSTETFSDFLNEPSDEQKTEGGLAYFTCIVMGLEFSEYVSWMHNGRKISTSGHIIEDRINTRYSLDFDSKFGKYNLLIQEVQRRDAGQYICTVFDKYDQVVAESRTANFTVQQIPQEHYPLCSTIAASYIVGQNIIVSCRSEITDPPVRLIWKRNNVDITPLTKAKIDNDNYRVDYSFIAKETDHRAVFVCELTTPVNPSIRPNCSSGPINVLYPPPVSIRQTEDAILGREAIIICSSDANPSEVTFEWSFNPQLDESLYVIENERILRILNTEFIRNGTTVTCKATNSIGSNTDVLTLTIKTSNALNNKPTSDKNNFDIKFKDNLKNKETKNNRNLHENSDKGEFSILLIAAIALACIVLILGLALIPVCYMRYTRREPSDTVSRGRPVSIPDVYFEPKDHVDPMVPQLGISAPWMRTVGVQVPGECEYDVTYTTHVSPQSRQAYYSQRMYTAASV